jgi:hypothetical protein
MRFSVSYSTAKGAGVVTARDSEDALEKARAWTEQGHEVEIRDDMGRTWTLPEFQALPERAAPDRSTPRIRPVWTA